MLPFELTKDTPYLALSGELWSVFYEYFNRNWSCYKGFLLYWIKKGQDYVITTLDNQPGSSNPYFSKTRTLTHLPLVQHIWMNWVSIGSDNDLLPVRHQAITWTNAELLSIRPLGTNFSEIRIKIQSFSFMEMHVKMSPAKWWPFCPGGDKSTILYTQ